MSVNLRWKRFLSWGILHVPSFSSISLLLARICNWTALSLNVQETFFHEIRIGISLFIKALTLIYGHSLNVQLFYHN